MDIGAARERTHRLCMLITGIALAALAALGLVLLSSRRHASGTSKLVAGLNAFWGVVTMLFFAPAGVLATMPAADESELGAVVLLLVAASGFGVGVSLFRSARRLLKRQELGRVARTASWSMLHHGAVVAAFFIVPVVEDVWLYCTVPCGIGMGLAWALGRRPR